MKFSNLKTKPKILIGICSPLVLLLILGAISIFNISSIVNTNERVEHTQNVLGKAADIIGSAVDMETGMRGYLLAGKEGFLDPYKGGEKATYERIKELQEIVSDNPKQVARLGEVKKVLREWQSQVTEPTIGLRRKIGDAATMNDMAKLVGEARGKKFFDKFRGQISTFIEREASLLKKRRATFQEAQNSSKKHFKLVVDTVGWVDHTHEVLAQAARILANAVDMETGMRGFLLAGKEEFLDPYKTGQKAFFTEMAKLQQTVSDNPPQVVRLKKAEQLIKDWNTQVTDPAIVLRRKVRDGQGSLKDIESLVAQAKGKKFFDAFRGIIAEFSKIEADLMGKRQKEMITAEKQVNEDLEIMKKNEGWVTHTYEVIEHVNDVLASAVDMETGMRGYLLAGPGLENKDEIGDMAQAVQVFKENAIENKKLAEETEKQRELQVKREEEDRAAEAQRVEDERDREKAEQEAEAERQRVESEAEAQKAGAERKAERQKAAEQEESARKEAERAAKIDELTQNFEQGITRVLGSVGTAVGELGQTSTTLSSTADETNQQATAVATAAEHRPSSPSISGAGVTIIGRFVSVMRQLHGHSFMVFTIR